MQTPVSGETSADKAEENHQEMETLTPIKTEFPENVCTHYILLRPVITTANGGGAAKG